MATSAIHRRKGKDEHGNELKANDESDDERHDITNDDRQFLQSDFNCGVCYEILILPTTLRCGHNFCRICLAQWYLQSKKKECPICRREYREKPETNNMISGLIEKSFKEEVEERTKKVMNSDNHDAIKKYDQAMDQKGPAGPAGNNFGHHFNWNGERNRNSADFCKGLLFMLGVVLVMYLVWYWRNIDDGILVKKPVIHWSADDVQEWLSTMPWTENYKENFINSSIDGRLLLSLEESHLTFLKIDLPLHKAALLSAIQGLRESGMKGPSTLWEFKSLHPGYALFLLFGIKDYPRLTFMYLYLFDYYNMFMPFVHRTCSEEDITSSSMFESLTSDDMIEFFTKMTFLPYLLVAQFAWEFINIHYWTSRFILAECLALTILEATRVRWLISGGWRDFGVMAKSHGKGILGTIVCIIVWPIVPNFICDIFFYLTLYCSPYLDLEKVYKIFKTGDFAV